MRRSALSTQHSALILASASPRRRELLAALGMPFAVAVAEVDESVQPGEAPAAAALRLARLKAEVVAGRTPDGAVVLGADTVVALGDRIFGKPADADEAAAMLRALRGRTHTVITGVALVDRQRARICVDAPSTAVTMRAYTDTEIAASIAAGTPFDKAGAYAIQDEAFAPVARIDGCYCNVVGLPLWTLWLLLRELRPKLHPNPPSDIRRICVACPLAVSGGPTQS